jgi:hypothetical protein
VTTCTKEERDAIARGEGHVVNGIWSANVVGKEPGNAPLKSSYIPLVPATTAMTASIPVTGVFTATAVPKSKSGTGRTYRMGF